MSDPFEDHMDSMLGLNEPPPEEPEPTPGEIFIENAKQRVERNSWRRANAGAKDLVAALRKNGDVKL